ncbi:MAG: apolipoprotein N-acyltransferase [Flavobacteriales bacterium]|nr:apolipoprotein N-acyltransferase [Flavobacteriales bacterium]
MRKLFLALLSGLLLAFSWPSIGIFPFVFFAFIPLLILGKTANNGKQVFWYSFLAFFIFNAITTYWVYHATLFGAIAAFVVNATLMAAAFYLFHKIKLNTKNRLGYLSFIVLWIAMEYLHLNWDLSWPWLTLGNVFANVPNLVQWYEFTGFLGGSIWVLIMNILLFNLYIKEDKKGAILFPMLVLLLPLFISNHLCLDFESDKKENLSVLIIQPNIDPYTDKFNVGFEQQLSDFIALAKTKLTQETELLIGPETALLEGVWENKIEATYSIRAFRDLQKEFPHLNILVGASTYKMFGHGEQKTTTARQIRNENIFYDAYNSAVFIPDSGEVVVYHKTKLVPGVEKMPFPELLDPLAKLAVDLGGMSGSLGGTNTLNNFDLNGKNIRPLICYESIYGEMNYSNSALIAVITNDGWWKNTAGYKQHFEYARLRAIEQRKTIVRSANTGISGVINAKGEVLEKTKWDKKVCISSEVSLSSKITFYNQFGNYIGRISVFIAAMLLIIAFVKGKVNK